ncbi:MAG: hypothetical protein ACK2UJ_22345 [Candidatus Promineifilaceae bacterium]
MSTYVAIALISAATLLLEISFLRLFAVQQFYHFAFMAVSLALLGAGASGSLLSVWKRRWPPAVLCLLFGLATAGSYLIVNYIPFDSFSIAWDGRQLLFLMIYFLSAALPFLFAGLIVGGELAVSSARVDGRSHLIYGANLLGSGAGSLASLLVLALVGGEGAVLVAAILGILSTFLFLLQQDYSASAQQRFVAVPALLFLLLYLAALVSPPPFWALRLSPYKTLSILLQTLDAEHTVSVFDQTTRVDVVESSTIHSMPGLSLTSPLGPPLQAGLLLDGDSLMPITALPPRSPDAAVLADNLPAGLAYRLRPGAKTLVLESGSGMDVLWAIAAGAEEITAIEEKKLVIDTLQETYGDFTSDLFADPAVQVINLASRVFARRPPTEHFDIVIVSLTTPHRPVTSGAYSLTEDYIYTVEAVDDYLNLLDENGLLVMTRWLQTPPSESGRLFAMIAQALEQKGLDPAQHLVAFRTLRTMTVLASLTPFRESDLSRTRQFLDERGFDAVYIPGIDPSEVNRFNILEQPSYYLLFQNILHDAETTYATYRYDIRPPSDDHPFFYHFFKWRQTPEILSTLGMTWQPFGGSGFFVLVILLIMVTLAAAVFILGPLLVWRREGLDQPPDISHWRGRVFVYFACLGLAFLFVEIPLSQRFILSLGQPVTALAFVLFALLIFSGLGSLTVKHWSLRPALAILVILVAIYPLLLQPLIAVSLGWPEWARVILITLSLAPIGYFMGLPFAAGIQVIEKNEAALTPWAWAINGSFSVISSVLAIMIALTWNFSTVLWLGAAAYAVALLVFGPVGSAAAGRETAAVN